MLSTDGLFDDLLSEMSVLDNRFARSRRFNGGFGDYKSMCATFVEHVGELGLWELHGGGFEFPLLLGKTVAGRLGVPVRVGDNRGLLVKGGVYSTVGCDWDGSLSDGLGHHLNACMSANVVGVPAGVPVDVWGLPDGDVMLVACLRGVGSGGFLDNRVRGRVVVPNVFGVRNGGLDRVVVRGVIHFKPGVRVDGGAVGYVLAVQDALLSGDFSNLCLSGVDFVSLLGVDDGLGLDCLRFPEWLGECGIRMPGFRFVEKNGTCEGLGRDVLCVLEFPGGVAGGYPVDYWCADFDHYRGARRFTRFVVRVGDTVLARVSGVEPVGVGSVRVCFDSPDGGGRVVLLGVEVGGVTMTVGKAERLGVRVGGVVRLGVTDTGRLRVHRCSHSGVSTC